MMTIENDFLKASFLTKGAEWRSFVEKVHGHEMLWQADPAFWGKSAPILFPIVGSLKGGRYEFEGKSYTLPRHGFARDREFAVVDHESWRIVFRQTSDDQTRAVYPFDWELEVEYRLWKKVLSTIYRVKNVGDGPMYFSIGAHPAFKCPQYEGKAFEDAYLQWELKEPLERWMLDANGLLSGETRPLPTAGKALNLTRPLFAEDAVVLKKQKSGRIELGANGQNLALSMEFPGFDYFGIWSAPNAPFVCLEPWCGVSDSATSSGKLEEKEGIQTLAAGSIWSRSFAITVIGV